MHFPDQLIAKIQILHNGQWSGQVIYRNDDELLPPVGYLECFVALLLKL